MLATRKKSIKPPKRHKGRTRELETGNVSADEPPELVLALHDEPEDRHPEISFDEEVSETDYNLGNIWKWDED